MSTRRRKLAMAVVTSLALPGCSSIFSPIPLWEVLKATGEFASMAAPSEPGEASDTVYFPHTRLSELCIEFNPQAQVADLVPALQLALRNHQIESRVYEGAFAGPNCQVWLRYNAQMAWDKAARSERYQSYVSAANLTLQTTKGQILSSSHYVLDPTRGSSKWASTQDKLAPVVSALVTGVVPVKPNVNLLKEST